MEQPIVKPRDRAELRLAYPGRADDDRFEYRREVARRAVDDLQHLGRRGLPLQRLVTLGSALGKLSSQIGYELN